ncbi:glycosyltransferase [Myxococcota bacterium]
MARSTDKPKLLVLVVAYFAESTLQPVLERIPRSLFQDYDCEVLVVDDASEDRTSAVGREYRSEHPSIPITVVCNAFNQGYGGNQKVGYTYAITHGFDWVALLHGDGQYAPEKLSDLLRPLVAGEAEAVFGSRMMDPLSSLRGGMPVYKYVGNRILTVLQNMLLGTRLSEFHSGYRVYSVAALQGIPFTLNTNDFHFDTEIIIQLLNARARIAELPIPTYYGDEICRVNGLRYAKDVLVATLRNVAHRSGVVHQRRFEPHTPECSQYDLKLGYASSHTYALEAVPAKARVLDLGDGPAMLAHELHRKGCHVTIVDRHVPAALEGSMTAVRQDLDEPLQVDPKEYDYILLLDVIEHLRNPEAFLERLRAQLDYRPRRLVLTTPNVAFFVQRGMLLLGQFNYGKAGILDRTHTRLFTFRTIKHLLRDTGFRLKVVRGIPAPFPKALGDGLVGRVAVAANLALIRLSKTLFSYQVYIEADSTPDVRFVVQDTLRRSDIPEPPKPDPNWPGLVST